MFEERLKKNEPLGKHTTFGVGGPASYFIDVYTKDELEESLFFANKNQLMPFFLGKGSNLIFDDRGWKGIVICNRIDFCHFKESSVEVGAGFSFSLLGTQSARKGLTGLEFAGGIPASVGGAVYMNAGANHKQTCDTLSSVVYISESGKEKVYSKNELEFRYRYSSFQQMKGAIVSAVFSLAKDPSARESRVDIITCRMATQPLKEKSAGCIFKNPTGELKSGALIEQCGLKGKRVGGAKVSEIHANFIVNESTATCDDVQKLVALIFEEVKRKTGIELEMEVRYIPYNG